MQNVNSAKYNRGVEQGPQITLLFLAVCRSVPTELIFLRTHVRPLTSEAKELIAHYSSLDTLIWWHEEFDSKEVDKIIAKRLDQGETPNFPYGKLVEVCKGALTPLSVSACCTSRERASFSTTCWSLLPKSDWPLSSK